MSLSSFPPQLGTLAVLKEISLNIDCRRALTDLGGVQQLVETLDDPARDLQILAAETIANVCKIRKARKIVRKSGGIPKLVGLRCVRREGGDNSLHTGEWDLSTDESVFCRMVNLMDLTELITHASTPPPLPEGKRGGGGRWD